MTSTCSSDDESTVRRRAEERAIKELEEQRRASRQRVLNIWDNLEKRYSRPIEDDDIVDLESLTLLQDAGNLREMQDAPYGSLSLAISDNEDDEDELAVWDDDHSAEATFYHGKSQLSEGDVRDLQDFLRAERLRREVQGDIDESENDEQSDMFQQREEEREEEDFEEREESSGREENLEGHEATSVSSFRKSVTEEEETDSEDELGVQPSEPSLQKDAYSDSRNEESDQEETDASSEDELAASDDGYVEYIRPTKPNIPVPSLPVEKARETHRTTRNHQLFTPTLSKSSVLSSTPEASGSRTLWKPRASSVFKPPAGEIHQQARGELARPPVRRSNVPPPRPKSLLGKRKLSPPGYRKTQELDDQPVRPTPTPSNRKFGLERRTISQDERYLQHRSAQMEDTSIRRMSHSPEKPPYHAPGDQLNGIITPSDLSQLVYHLREVNEWVKSHQIIDFDFGDHSQSSSCPTPNRPSRTSMDSYVTPPHTSFRRGAYPSSVLSQSASSTAGPPPTPTRLFASSPIKHKSQSKINGSRMVNPKSPDTGSELSRRRSYQYDHRQSEGIRHSGGDPRRQSSRPFLHKEQSEDEISVRAHPASVKLSRDEFFSPHIRFDRSRQNISRSVRPRLN